MKKYIFKKTMLEQASTFQQTFFKLTNRGLFSDLVSLNNDFWGAHVKINIFQKKLENLNKSHECVRRTPKCYKL